MGIFLLLLLISLALLGQLLMFSPFPIKRKASKIQGQIKIEFKKENISSQYEHSFIEKDINPILMSNPNYMVLLFLVLATISIVQLFSNSVNGQICQDNFGGYCVPKGEDDWGCCEHGYPLCCGPGHSQCAPRYGGNMTRECPSSSFNGPNCSEEEVCLSINNDPPKTACIPKEALHCNRYAKIEERAQCGPNGYPLGHGLKYCSRFFQHWAKFNEKGQNFIKCTAQCLLTKMDTFINAHEESTINCVTLNESAYNAHPDCYVDCGFCSAIVGNIVAYYEVLEVKDLELSQIKDTFNKCLIQGLTATRDELARLLRRLIPNENVQ